MKNDRWAGWLGGFSRSVTKQRNGHEREGMGYMNESLGQTNDMKRRKERNEALISTMLEYQHMEGWREDKLVRIFFFLSHRWINQSKRGVRAGTLSWTDGGITSL